MDKRVTQPDIYGGVEAPLARLTAAAMIALALFELLHLVGGCGWASAAGRAAALAVVLVMTPRFELREWVLLAAAAALTAGLVGADGSWDGPRVALDRGAYFAAFILLMTLLREAAVTSPAVLAMGHYLTRQPPGRRFVATYVGGHLSGVLLNFGAISLLAPLVQRGVRAEPIMTDEDERRARIREQRQLSALIRGFACVITWAPTTLTQAIILHSLPALDVGRVMTLGLALSVLFLAVGWAEDRLRWGKPRRRVPGMALMPFPKKAARNLGVVALCLVIGTYGPREALGISTAEALMLVSPFMLAGWVYAQNIGRGGRTALGGRIREIATGPLPRMTHSAYMLGVAGFIGSAAAELAPVDAIAGHLSHEHIRPWIFLTALPVIVMVAGNIAVAPVMMVVFLAAVISALPVLPADPDLIALSLGAGWALSMTAAPNATGPILLAGVTGLPATTLTWRWNGIYSLAALAALGAVFFVIA